VRSYNDGLPPPGGSSCTSNGAAVLPAANAPDGFEEADAYDLGPLGLLRCTRGAGRQGSGLRPHSGAGAGAHNFPPVLLPRLLNHLPGADGDRRDPKGFLDVWGQDKQ
jgi:hypothetical protein